MLHFSLKLQFNFFSHKYLVCYAWLKLEIYEQMCIDLHVICSLMKPLILTIIGMGWQILVKFPTSNFMKTVQWFSSCFIHTDRRTNCDSNRCSTGMKTCLKQNIFQINKYNLCLYVCWVYAHSITLQKWQGSSSYRSVSY